MEIVNQPLLGFGFRFQKIILIQNIWEHSVDRKISNLFFWDF